MSNPLPANRAAVARASAKVSPATKRATSGCVSGEERTSCSARDEREAEMKRGRRTEPIGLAPFLAAMPRSRTPSASRSRRGPQYTVPSAVREQSHPAHEGGVSPITPLHITEKRTVPPTVVRRRVALAFAAFVLIGATDGATGVLLPSLQTYYGVGKSVVSLLFVSLTAGYIVAAFGSGLLVALLGERRFLALGAAAFALGALLVSLRPPFALVLLTMIAFGFGFAIIDAGLNAYITAMPESTTRLNNLHAFYGIGGFLGPIIAAAILARGLPWNTVYALWCACGLLLVVGFARLFDVGSAGTRQPTTKAAGTSLLTDILRLRLVWLAAIFMLFYVGAEISIGSWSFSFLTEVRHHGSLLSGWSVSGYWLGITVGRLTLARLAARLAVADTALIRYCLIGAGVGVLCIWFAPLPAVAAFGLWLAGFSLGPIYPTTIALLPSLVPARLVPSAVGFLAGLGSAGAALFPWLAGTLAQAVGLWSLMPYVIALLVVLSGLWLALGLSAHSKPAV